jgi:hypothetical protein
VACCFTVVEVWFMVFSIFMTRFRSIGAEVDIRRTVRCEIKEQWTKIGIYAIKYKEKLESLIRKYESEEK